MAKAHRALLDFFDTLPRQGANPRRSAVEFFRASTATGNEAVPKHPVYVNCYCNGILARDVTVTVSSIGGGTATPGVDYVPTSTVLTFPAGSSYSNLAVATLETLEDTAVEGDETVLLGLAGLTGPATLGAQTSHTVTITDDDDVVSFASPAGSSARRTPRTLGPLRMMGSGGAP